MAHPVELQSRIAPQGVRISLVLLGLSAACFMAVGLGLSADWAGTAALVLLALAAANAAFFRNPRREIPQGEGVVVSPADGRVVEVVRCEDPAGFVGNAWRIAIFLSIFSVHVNRAPVSGKVRRVARSGNKFLAAFNSSASDLNVQSRMDLEAADGRRFSVVQITGLIARRIVAYAREGDTLERGQPYGLICYGSRVEIYLPADCQIRVKPGDRVRGGSSLIAEVSA